MDDPVPVALEAGPGLAFGLGIQAAAACRRVTGIQRKIGWHGRKL